MQNYQFIYMHKKLLYLQHGPRSYGTINIRFILFGKIDRLRIAATF